MFGVPNTCNEPPLRSMPGESLPTPIDDRPNFKIAPLSMTNCTPWGTSNDEPSASGKPLADEPIVYGTLSTTVSMRPSAPPLPKTRTVSPGSAAASARSISLNGDVNDPF